MSLKQQITDDMKAAMKSGDKHTVGVTRLINAAIKQKEIDERIPWTTTVYSLFCKKWSSNAGTQSNNTAMPTAKTSRR